MTSTQQSTPKSRKKKRTTPTPTLQLARYAVDAVLDKKARDVVVMDMRNVSSVADYFVVCTGESDRQVKAIADAVREEVREACSELPWHTEGTNHLQWVLLDYVDVVVHVFDEERRTFYDLERLWGDAPHEGVPEDGSATDVALLQDETASKQASAG
jgi:ribosome-associated protein